MLLAISSPNRGSCAKSKLSIDSVPMRGFPASSRGVIPSPLVEMLTKAVGWTDRKVENSPELFCSASLPGLVSARKLSSSTVLTT